MLTILESIKNAKQGSDIYHLIEKVAENVKEENPKNTDDENWFESQRRINRYLLEEKVAAVIFGESQDPNKKYEDCLEEARKKLDYLRMEEVNKIEQEGITPNKIIECDLKYHSNYYYYLRKKVTPALPKNLDLAFEDWKNAIDCVAFNVSKY